MSKGGIYIASKIKHAPLWRAMRNDGMPIISTWIDQAGDGETSDFANLWGRCVREASTADVLIVYRADASEELKGALVEMGVALASKRAVMWVGPTETNGARYTCAAHDGISRDYTTIESAFAEAKRLVERKRDQPDPLPGELWRGYVSPSGSRCVHLCSIRHRMGRTFVYEAFYDEWEPARDEIKYFALAEWGIQQHNGRASGGASGRASGGAP